MKKLFILFNILILAIPLTAEESVYIDGINAFRTDKKAPYVDIHGNMITGMVVKSEIRTGGRISETRFPVVSGYENGTVTIYQNGEKTVEAEMSKGVIHGKITHYYNSGAVLAVSNFVNGELNGILTNYNEDGTITKEYWYRDSVLLAGYEYKDGEPVPVKKMMEKMQETICNRSNLSAVNEYLLGSDAFFDNRTQLYVDKQKKAINGRVIKRTSKELTEMDVSDGMLNGVVRVYANGALSSETHYKDNLRHGTSKIYYPNNRPELSIQYSYDVVDGIITSWYENGNIEHEVIIRKGNAMSGYLDNGGKFLTMTQGDFKEMERVYLALP